MNTKRCIKTRANEHVVNSVAVRKHRAPKGALRPVLSVTLSVALSLARKHRAPNGALRRSLLATSVVNSLQSQKAPSAKRCIKTLLGRELAAQLQDRVRKHRAPKGALRLNGLNGRLKLLHRQKEPSAKMCIKTQTRRRRRMTGRPGQKAPSSKRCI